MNETLEESSVAKNTYVFAISSNNNEESETKTILGSDANGVFSTWESGDNLIYKINTANHGTTGVTIGTPVTFSITDDLVADDIIYAWFPYCVDETDTPDGVWFNVPHAQSQAANFDLDAMPMVAKPITMTSAMITAWTSDKTQALADVQFANLGSLINFKVYNTNSAYNSEKLRSITFNAGESVISGTFALDLTQINFNNENTVKYTSEKLVDDGDLPVGREEELGRSSTITTTMSSNTTIPTSKASALDVYMVVLPGTYAGTITVTTTKANYTYPLSSREFARSDINKLGLNLNSANATRADYVTLNWTSPTTGKSDLADAVGVTTYGLGSDYAESNAPYRLKFDDTGDYIIVKTDKAIGKVSIDYKKIGGTGNSTFTVQESVDGETFTNVQTVTATGSSNATGTMETSSVFSDDCRYVKLIFTKASNLAVGAITITQLDLSTKRISVQSNLNVPVEGAADATLSYTAQNFVDDITVSKTGCVSSASKTSAGIVTYTVGANYESSVASGTIVLTSAAAPSITRTVSVSQPASSLTCSASPGLVVTIPNDEETASFTITTPEFGWNASATKDNDDVNLRIKTGESTYSATHSGAASDDAQTITVYSTTAAAASQTTLGTITIYRTASAGDDPQAITVTIKKAATGGGGPTLQTLYLETFGNNGSSNTAVADATTYTATQSMFTDPTNSVVSHYSSAGKVGKNSVAPSSGYSGASGNSAVWYNYNGTANLFTVEKIDISSATGITVSFGLYYTDVAPGTACTLTAYYTINGGTEQTLTFTQPESKATWTLCSGTIAGTGSSLKLRFEMVTTKTYTIRLDDIKVTGTK